MILLDNLVGPHILVGSARNSRSVVDVLRSLTLHRAIHGLLHGLELLNIALWLIQGHISRRGRSWPTHHDRGYTLALVDQSRRILSRILHLTSLGAHRHLRGRLVQVGNEMVLAEQRLGLLDHDTRTGELFIENIFVVEDSSV